jgi:5'-3' exonuclease
MIMDVNQIMMANLMVLNVKNDTVDLNEDMLRHMILNSIRSNRIKFKQDYGELVLAFDSGTNWRKSVFPHYKASRQRKRNESVLPWDDIYKYFQVLREEFMEVLPYPVVSVPMAEADDVIGAIVRYWQMDNYYPILIISGDTDYIQLHNSRTHQWNPVQKKWVKYNDDPSVYLSLHILEGDSGDGIPNVLSDDDTFIVEGKRQHRLTVKQINFVNNTPEAELPLNIRENLVRNSKLIDLSQTPLQIKSEALLFYRDQRGKNRKKLLNYFMDKNLNNLTASINDF